MINKYGTWDNVVRGVHHYERVAIYRDSNGSNLKVADLNPPLIINKEKYDTLLPDERLSVSNLDYELGLNENKISVITKDKVKNYSKTSKVNCAKHIIDSIYNQIKIKWLIQI